MIKEHTYDNIPFEDIRRFVREDLKIYGQDNQSPLSLTRVYREDGKLKFRHYELGHIIGYIIFGNIPEDDNTSIDTMISEIYEDDEYWFAPNTPMYMAASWMNNAKKTLERMYKWYHEHIEEGFDENNKWNQKIIKEITPEKIFRENLLSSCELFEGPDNE